MLAVLVLAYLLIGFVWGAVLAIAERHEGMTAGEHLIEIVSLTFIWPVVLIGLLAERKAYGTTDDTH